LCTEYASGCENGLIPRGDSHTNRASRVMMLTPGDFKENLIRTARGDAEKAVFPGAESRFWIH